MASFKKITGKIKGVFKRKTRAQEPDGDTKPAYGLPAHVAEFLTECPETKQLSERMTRTDEELAAIAVSAGYGGNNAPRPSEGLRII